MYFDVVTRDSLYGMSNKVSTANRDQAPVVQLSDSAIHRINHYLVDKCYGNQLHYPLESDLSGG